MRRFRLPPWIRSPETVEEAFQGRSRTFVGALIYLFGRESTILVCSFSFAFLLSVFPFIVLLLTLASYLDWTELRETAFAALYYFFPISQEWIVRNLDAYTQRVGALQLVAFVLLAWAGSAFFFALEAALDSAYRVTRYRHFVGSQALGTLLTLGFGFVTFLGLVFMRAVLRVAETVTPWEAAREGLVAVLTHSVGFGVAAGLLLAAFYWLPNRQARAAEVLPEVLLATVLLLLGNWIFRWVAPGLQLQDIYGPFYISVTLLLWAYVCGCIVIGSARLGADGFFRRQPRPAAPESRPLPEEAPLDAPGQARRGRD